MSLLNDRFEKIVCINLKERKDKYLFIQERFIRHDIHIDEWFHPVILNYSNHFVDLYADANNVPQNNHILFNKQFPNEFGTLHSHYYVIKSALLEGVENLFVFEDDCCFHEDWDELLPKYFDSLPTDADGVLLYSFMSRLEQQNVRVKPRWTKGFASWSLLAYGMNKKAMQGYIDLIDTKPMIADKATWEMMTHQGYNFYIASPPLVTPSKELTSNIRGENKNYDKIQNVFMLGVDTTKYH